jgi:hypothetical protein
VSELVKPEIGQAARARAEAMIVLKLLIGRSASPRRRGDENKYQLPGAGPVQLDHGQRHGLGLPPDPAPVRGACHPYTSIWPGVAHARERQAP